MANTKDSVTQIVLDSLADAWKEYDRQENPTIESDIYGGESILDSTGLVSLVLDIEDRLDEELGETVSLIDERAVSQENSPFQNVATMVTFIMTLIEESRGE